MGIHARVGQRFWERVAEAVSDRFRTGDYTGGLVQGIEQAGALLALHFPFDRTGDANEISDVVDVGGTPGPRTRLVV